MNAREKKILLDAIEEAERSALDLARGLRLPGDVDSIVLKMAAHLRAAVHEADTMDLPIVVVEEGDG
jgi:hypothetical protein